MGLGPLPALVSEGTALPQDLTLIREIRQTANSFLLLKLLQKSPVFLQPDQGPHVRKKSL